MLFVNKIKVIAQLFMEKTMAEIMNTDMVGTMNHLKLDNGATMSFEGQNFAEVSWFVEDELDSQASTIKRQRIFTTPTGAQVYSISEGDGANKSNRAYMVELQENMLHINDGKASLDLEKDMFMLFVKSMLDKVDANSDQTIEHVEELLKAANS